ncbi:MAG: choice-of-anchor D domain-containing protein, partial [Deltaproteobacteria bacterium]
MVNRSNVGFARTAALAPLVLAAAALLAACPDAAPGRPDGGGSASCTRHEDCPAPQVCVSGACAEHGGPCTSPFDCPAGLECSGGVCSRPAIPDAGTPDGGAPDGGEGDGGPAAAARIEVTPAALDFGAVRAGSSASLSFTITSVGERPLRVLTVEPDTGTSPEFSVTPVDAFGDPVSLPQSLEPGAGLEVEVVYAPTDGVADTGQVLVVSDAENAPTVRVALSSEYKGSFDIVTSADRLDFGYVMPGTRATQTLTVTNQGANSSVLTLTEVRTEPTNSQVFELSLPSPTPIYLFGGDSIDIEVSYAPPAAPLGIHEEALLIASTDPDEPVLTLPLTGASVTPAVVEISPDAIDFGPVQQGFPEVRTITIRNGGGQAFAVEDYEIALDGGGQFSVSGPAPPLTVSPGGQVDLQVTFAPLFNGPAQSSGVDIVHTDPLSPSDTVTVNVPVTGEGINPLATVFPTAIDFGGVYRRSTSPPQSVRIRNNGYGPLIVSAIDPVPGTSAEFALAPVTLPATVLPNAEMVFELRYSPTGLGSDAGAFEVVVSDQNNPRITVTVTGEGVDCAPGTADINGDPSDACECQAWPANGDTCTYPNGQAGCDAQGHCFLDRCDPGYWDIDGDPANGCEYACTFQSATDLPDAAFVDANCDGIDGTIAEAVFVSATSGSDASPDCSIDAPCQSIGRALAVAASAGKTQVYLQSGDYNEIVEVSTDVALYGGYDAAWQRADRDTAGHRVRITGGLHPGDQQYMTVRVRGGALTVADLTLVGVDAAGTFGGGYGRSSYVVHAQGATLDVRRVTFEQGNGAPGLPGAAGSDAAQTAAPAGAQGGASETSNDVCRAQPFGAGGAGGTNPACPTGTAGGAGGDGGRMDTCCLAGLCLLCDCSATAGGPGSDGAGAT